MNELSTKSYAEGASWSTRATLITIGAVISVYVVVCLVTGNPIGGIIVNEHPHGQGK